MKLRLTRRCALLLPLLLAACGGDEEVPPPVDDGGNFPPLRYGYLPPIKLNIQRVEMIRDFSLPAGEDEMIGLSPVDPIDTLFAMARDRLQPVAQSGLATFRVVNASITRHGNTLTGVLAVRLDVHDGDNAGFVVARATADHSGRITSQRAAVYDLLKTMMFQMNVELEYQIRNKLKAWVVGNEAAPAPQVQPQTPAAPPPEPAPVAPPDNPPEAAPEPPPAEMPPPE
jgi:hypothetical protein